ncbi:cytochrome p450-like protein [Trypanosoma theileri]|uniref:Cytochrome p450-like protein n=1 Tax=Trypanosoma theileri TaxID=67003 RepID=A0A1X0P9X8_9TRYP|nr:cytochrome p450-like protein [Trypanosoma theileri]ORC93734.1 cytochrome p450-like protein [Trypanosoma theileri]
MLSLYVKRIFVTGVPTTIIFLGVWFIRSLLLNPPGIPSPPITSHEENDGFFTRHVRRFFMQHFYVLHKDESMFRLLQWTRFFHHHPFLMRIFFRPHIIISKSEDLEEVLLRQEANFCKHTGYILLRAVIGDGLLAMMDKEKHRVHRRILQSVFSSSNIRGIANEVMRVHVLRQLNIFLKLLICAGDGIVTINISEHMHRMTLGIVSEAAFRASVEDSVVVLEAFSIMTKFNRLNYLCPYYRTPSQKEAEKILIEISNALIQNNEEDDNSSKRRVVLDALIEELNIHFDRKDVVHHLVTFLFAGHDTTSNTLNFLFALLARNEKVQNRLYDELEMIMPATCSCPTIEELLSCEYLVAVVREAMRLFPSAPLIYRDALQDVYLPSSDVVIPKGSVCVLNIFAVHRSITIYGDDADEFHPERWLQGEGQELRSRCGNCGYMPFSVGNRNCIGKEYGYYEVLIATAVFIRHLRVESVGAFPRTQFSFTMSSPDPCRVRLIRRPDVSTDAMMKSVRILQEYETAIQFPTRCEAVMV